MPVFHTKTIESILEPVAQQVSRLVILHEEAEDGNAMPDLGKPVLTVKLAVENLVKVGHETCANSEDVILKQDMPKALARVEEACQLLLDAADMLRADPYSSPGRKKLIEGARGILQGVSALLLTFDESEVRKIIRFCKQVLEYLAITEVVETMEDLVTYVKNLSPVLTRMTKEVDTREKELTHQVHREMLTRSLEQVKNLTPVLISGIKIYITTRLTGHSAVQEAQENRDYTVKKMTDEINEIIRVLQLTTYDEDEWEADDLTIMRKALNAIEGKMKQALDWLMDPQAPAGGIGEKSLRSILEDARRVAERCSDPTDRDNILQCVNEISNMVDSLSQLRQQGKGGSPQAMALAKSIAGKLSELQSLVQRAVANTERAGVRKLAHTVPGKMEQALRWLANPGVNDGGLGELAARSVVQEGRRVAETCNPGEKEDLLRTCSDAEKLINQVADMCRRGQGDTPNGKTMAKALTDKLRELQSNISTALVHQVAEDFVDLTTPLKQLSEAAMAPMSTPGRDPNFDDKSRNFQQHSQRICNTARQVAAAGGCTNKRTIEAINATAQNASELTPQVIFAARIVFKDPENTAALEHFELLKKQWSDTVETLRSLVDEAIDSVAFIKACEEGIIRDTDNAEKSIKSLNVGGIVNNTSSIARRANRVLQVAGQEADNSEDPSFVDRVNAASNQLKNTIAPMVQDARNLATRPDDSSCQSRWRDSNRSLINAVGKVREAVTPASEMPMPPPPDLSSLRMHDRAPPRPPLPQDPAPPRPPPPETDDESEPEFPMPLPNQPIMMAAHSLHMEAKQWSSRDNDIVAAAKRMALLMMRLSQLVRGEGGSKKELIATAKQLAEASEEITRLAKNLARECTDKRMRTNLLQVCERIPTIGTQLKILSTVKATMLGAQEPIPSPDGSEIICGSEEDEEATEMLIGNAQNLMQSVKETVRAAQAASIKIRTDAGCTVRWVRKRPWYT